MKKLLLGMSGLAICAVLAGCGNSGSVAEDSNRAIDLISKACVAGVPELTWQERTNLAAEAFALDKHWDKFYEATSSLASVDLISKNQSEWVNADGNDGLQMAYINAKMYAIYFAECKRLGVFE